MTDASALNGAPTVLRTFANHGVRTGLDGAASSVVHASGDTGRAPIASGAFENGIARGGGASNENGLAANGGGAESPAAGGCKKAWGLRGASPGLVELDETARAAAAIDVARSFAFGCPTMVFVRTTGREVAALAGAVGAGVFVRARAAGANENWLGGVGSGVLQSSEKVGVPTRLIGAAVLGRAAGVALARSGGAAMFVRAAGDEAAALGRARISNSLEPDRARCFSANEAAGVLARPTGNEVLAGERAAGDSALEPRRSESEAAPVRDDGDGALARSVSGAARSRDATDDAMVPARGAGLALVRSAKGAVLLGALAGKAVEVFFGPCSRSDSRRAASNSPETDRAFCVSANEEADVSARPAGDDTLVVARAAVDGAADDGAAGTLGLTRSERRVDVDVGAVARSESASRRSSAATSPNPASAAGLPAGEDSLAFARSESDEVLVREAGACALVRPNRASPNRENAAAFPTGDDVFVPARSESGAVLVREDGAGALVPSDTGAVLVPASAASFPADDDALVLARSESGGVLVREDGAGALVPSDTGAVLVPASAASFPADDDALVLARSESGAVLVREDGAGVLVRSERGAALARAGTDEADALMRSDSAVPASAGSDDAGMLS
jgi:hypothetical protein